jgi:hypothetical protein
MRDQGKQLKNQDCWWFSQGDVYRWPGLTGKVVNACEFAAQLDCAGLVVTGVDMV